MQTISMGTGIGRSESGSFGLVWLAGQLGSSFQNLKAFHPLTLASYTKEKVLRKYALE
jgi:hypothetical protein